MYFGCFGFRGELGFLNCDDIYMCVVNKPFELLKFVFDSVYVDIQYDEIYLTFTTGCVCLFGVCSPEVVLGLLLSLFLLNIRSLPGHLRELVSYLDCLNTEFTIIALTET